MDETSNANSALNSVSGTQASEDSELENGVCKKCHGTGIVKEANGSCHTCFSCLLAGRLDQHSDELPNMDRFKL